MRLIKVVKICQSSLLLSWAFCWNQHENLKLGQIGISIFNFHVCMFRLVEIVSAPRVKMIKKFSHNYSFSYGSILWTWFLNFRCRCNEGNFSFRLVMIAFEPFKIFELRSTAKNEFKLFQWWSKIIILLRFNTNLQI